MLRRLTVKLVALSVLAMSLLVPASALAYNPLGGVDCSGQARESAVCQSSGGDPITGSNGIIIKATNIVAIVAGAAAVIFLVFSGIKYITSNGSPGQTSKARESILYAVVGLIVIAAGRTIINFIVSRI